jgi:hypothetical protein
LHRYTKVQALLDRAAEVKAKLASVRRPLHKSNPSVVP